MVAERDDWFSLAKETSEKLIEAEADITLQSTLWKAAWEEMNSRTVKKAKLQKQKMANVVELSQSSAKHIDLNNDLSLVK